MAGLPNLAALKQRTLAGQGITPAETEPESEIKSTETVEPEQAGEGNNNNVTSYVRNNVTSSQVTNVPSEQRNNVTSYVRNNSDTSQTPSTVDANDLAALVDEILAKTKTPLVHQGARVPDGLMQALEGYMGDNWRLKIKKQDLAARAFQLLYHELKTGKALVLLGTEEGLGLSE